MPEFFIRMSYGYAGTESCDVIEAATLQDAEREAWEIACERVEVSAEPYIPSEHDRRL